VDRLGLNFREITGLVKNGRLQNIPEDGAEDSDTLPYGLPDATPEEKNTVQIVKNDWHVSWKMKDQPELSWTLVIQKCRIC
jgi:hypothetical protein